MNGLPTDVNDETFTYEPVPVTVWLYVKRGNSTGGVDQLIKLLAYHAQNLGFQSPVPYQPYMVDNI